MTAALATDRQALILEHYPLVRNIAGRMVRRFPANVELDELVNVGVLGLIDAVDRFDPARQVPFRAYAEIRIRGAIVDALRETDWVPRSVRRKHNRIESVRSELRKRHGREPEQDEIASFLELDIDRYRAMESDARIKQLISLDAPSDDHRGLTAGDRVASGGDDIAALIEAVELRSQVERCVRNLPAKERDVVGRYYLLGQTLRDIGEQIGVTESRACQLRGQGVRRLRFRLARILDIDAA